MSQFSLGPGPLQPSTFQLISFFPQHAHQEYLLVEVLLITVFFDQDLVAAQTGVVQSPVTELLLGYFQWVLSCATEANPAPYSGSWILWCPRLVDPSELGSRIPESVCASYPTNPPGFQKYSQVAVLRLW